MPEHNNSMMNSSNIRDSSMLRGMQGAENTNERTARVERVNANRRIIRVSNHQMRNPNYWGSPPPYHCHTECTRCLNETARRINRRANIIAEGDTAADLDPDLERTGPVSTGGMWTQYVLWLNGRRVEALARLRSHRWGSRFLLPPLFYSGYILCV